VPKKFRKLIVTPQRFFVDAFHKRSASIASWPLLTGKRPRLFVFGLSPWKRYLGPFFPDCHLIYIDRNLSLSQFQKIWAPRIGSRKPDRMLIWGFKAPSFVTDFVAANNVPLLFAEDGFLRSIELGASKVPPYSLCIDTRTPYFDSRHPSDLELLLLGHNFSADHCLMSRARLLVDHIIEAGLSKYNQGASAPLDPLPDRQSPKRVLVLGQVEDDASITYGCTSPINNNDLVRLAHRENPGAEIIFKPHPDVMKGYRKELSDPDEIKHLCNILKNDISLAAVLSSSEHVYTITSLAGFEAALRGIPVTTVGCPFYAGWGFTDDRQPSPRRTRNLTPLEVFAGAYILYPKYSDPVAGVPTSVEHVVERLTALRAASLAS
jgi:capsular polysaccharide export protein